MLRRLLERGWVAVLLAFAAAAVAAGWFLPRTSVDASTRMLLDEKDPDLAYYNESRLLWASDDEFAIFACRRDDWFTPESLAMLRDIAADLQAVPHVSKVQSVFSVPLLRNRKSPLPFPIPTSLDAKGVDVARAKEELLGHTLARGVFLSEDGRDAVLLAYLETVPELTELEREQDAATARGDLAKVAELEPRHEPLRAELRARRRAMVDGVRAVAAKWSPKLAEPVALSGLPIINMNLIEHVSHDLDVFGVASFAIFVLAFALIYRRFRWVALPIATCVMPVVLVLGAMAFLGLRLTIITANLPLLIFVIMLPYTVYLVERYRERRARDPSEPHAETTAGAARDVWLPCLYSCTTTMAGFASLLTSGVKPVWWFGLMMTIGLGAGLACAFLFMPAASIPLGALDDPRAKAESEPHGLVRFAERLVLRAPALVVTAAVVVLAVAAWGVTKVSVENKFIDYFHESSEVHAGLRRIDERMGGTTPLDVVLRSKEPGYFRTPKGLAAVDAAAEFFRTCPEAGHVSSIGRLVEEARKSLPGATVDVLSRIPQVKPLFRDLANEDFSATRLLVRFRETAPTLQRSRILADLRAFLASKPELAGLEVRPTGVFLLYANMLESLIESQKDTFLMVVAAIFAMLVLLFRSLRLSFVVLVPQVLPAVVCLGTMGFLGVPLDLITVMIAAVAMGVGIDAAIQYTVRFRIELDATGGDRRAAVTRSHATIGRSIWIATSIMVAGFVVLGASDFVPTVSFGVFNALAMLMGQVAALTVLPALFLLTGLPKPRTRDAG